METTKQETKRRGKASGLTDTAVRNAKPKEKPYRLRDANGLFLQVEPNGAKLWRFRFWLHEKEGLMALGRYPDVSLADARDRRDDARKLVANGINPVHEAQQAKIRATQEYLRNAAGTFEAACADWRKLTDPTLRPATVRQREREIAKYLQPKLGTRRIDGIERLELVGLLKTVNEIAPEVARNLSTYLRAIFEHALNTGALKGGNPAPPSTSIVSKRRPKNNAMIATDRIGQFLVELDRANVSGGVRSATLLKILCVTRKAEACGARWRELDLDAALWRIPPERTKMKREHVVPLPSQAVALLRDLHEKHPPQLDELDFIFPNRRDPRRSMAPNSLNALLDRMGFGGGDATPHGWRSVFSTHFNARGANSDVVERCLAHSPKDDVRAAYNRHEYRDERRGMLQEWGDYLDAEKISALDKEELQAA